MGAGLGKRFGMRTRFGKPATAFCIAVTLGASSSAAADSKAEKRLAELIAMTPETFAFRTTLEDDDLEDVAVFSTRPAFSNAEGGDIFIRAFVDKAKGGTAYQLVFRSPSLRAAPRLYQMNMKGPDGLLTTKTVRIDGDVNCLRYGCYHTELVGGDVEGEWLRWVAASYVPNTQNPVALRIKSMSGLDQDINLLPAEAAGLLIRVDEYRARKGLGTEKGS